MDEKTESLIERAASLIVGVVMVLIATLALVTTEARTVLLSIGIPLISIAFGIQLLNSLPHAWVDARNYVKNSNTPKEIVVSSDTVDNDTQIPIWIQELGERAKEVIIDFDSKHIANIEKAHTESITKEEPPPAPENFVLPVILPAVESVHEITIDDQAALTGEFTLEPEPEPKADCEPCEELAKADPDNF